ncbi:MAG TPA: hypothetical protein VFB31_11580 [Pseudolabrys sp.]|nr:hypothetical protein [Pseudolabrys sp.]
MIDVAPEWKLLDYETLGPQDRRRRMLVPAMSARRIMRAHLARELRTGALGASSTRVAAPCAAVAAKLARGRAPPLPGSALIR